MMGFRAKGAKDAKGAKGGGQSGLVLIITLLVVLGLSLIGAIIMERTRTDTATSGSLRAAEQTSYVSEIGTMVSMRTFALNYSMYRKWMTMGTRRNSYAFERASFDTGVAGAPATLIDKTGVLPGSLGYSDLRPDYDVLVNRPYEYGDSAGYSVSGTQGVSFCFRRYTFTSAAELAATTGPAGRRDSRAVMRATTVIGPTDCTM
ncbi:MAG: hypothetical protein HY905_00840 [Deltaproteobacteria bacterium]|nr:hypothetical protein [Deltaproteobacteria bacterium]